MWSLVAPWGGGGVVVGCAKSSREGVCEELHGGWL